jgi:hypothetical protein
MEALLAVGAFVLLFTAFVILPNRLIRRTRNEED